MENYFNYFTEIEEHYQRRRGTISPLSPVDWALIETWKDAGIALEAVLRGIDATFDRYDARPAKTRKINSLAYCSQEVLSAAEDMKEAAVGAGRAENPEAALNTPEIAAYLIGNARLLDAATLPDGTRAIAAESARTLRDLASGVEQSAAPPLEDLERRLTVLEEKLLAALLAATPDQEIVSVRAQADHELAPYRRKMSGAQIAQLQKQYLNKRLLERYAVPRLSLFYM